MKSAPNPMGIFIEDMELTTSTITSEMVLCVLSVVAQGECEQKSAVITWSIVERFKKSILIVLTHNLLGYSKHRFESIILESNEVTIVKFIFSSFIKGI